MALVMQTVEQSPGLRLASGSGERTRPRTKRRGLGVVAAALALTTVVVAGTTDALGARPRTTSPTERQAIAESIFLKRYNSANAIGKFKLLFVTGAKIDVPAQTEAGGINSARNIIPHETTVNLGGHCLAGSPIYETRRNKGYTTTTVAGEVFVGKSALGEVIDTMVVAPDYLQIEDLKDAKSVRDIQPFGYNQDTEAAMARLGCWPWGGNFVNIQDPETFVS